MAEKKKPDRVNATVQASLDLHNLRALDPTLDALAREIQDTAAAAKVFPDLNLPTPVLVTGSSGYLGRTLVLALRNHGITTVGIDLKASDTTDFVGSVVDYQVLAKAAEGCRAVFHTAALHAPHAPTHSEEQFWAVNVAGTTNVLKIATLNRMDAMVHTSTTSLMITQAVKDAEAAKKVVMLDEACTGWEGEPRNKYGRSKLEAERRCCHHAAITGLPVVILRTSRFFPEDVIPEAEAADKKQPVSAGAASEAKYVSATEAEKKAASTANLKANELLGRRVALSDLVDGHFRAMSRASEPSVRNNIFTLSSPSPFLQSDTYRLESNPLGLISERFPAAAALYEKVGWVLPDAGLIRVYHSCKAVKALGWQVRWNFARLLEGLEKEDADAVLGRY